MYGGAHGAPLRTIIAFCYWERDDFSKPVITLQKGIIVLTLR